MTISSNTSAPLFVVFGATGNQGGSVIKAISEDEEEFRVRAITRDANKPASKAIEAKGCEMFALADSSASNPNGLEQAFQGARLAFGVTLTDYFSPDGFERELATGKAMADAAKKAGVKHYLWSGVPSQTKLSNGKHPVRNFDTKAEITEHARSIGLNVIDVQPASFASNYWTDQPPRKQEDGSYVQGLAFEPDSRIPMCDIPEDYGKYALAAYHHGLKTIIAASEYVVPSQISEAISQVSGVDVKYVRVPYAVMHGILEGMGGKGLADGLVDMFQCFSTTGYFGGADLAESNRILKTPARTFAQAVEANKDEVMKCFA